MSIIWVEGLGQLENPVTSSGMELLDLPACSIVPQPTTLPLAPSVLHSSLVIYKVVFISFRYKKSGSATFLNSNSFLINNSMEIT
jgi:hypothetical protein